MGLAKTETTTLQYASCRPFVGIAPFSPHDWLVPGVPYQRAAYDVAVVLFIGLPALCGILEMLAGVIWNCCGKENNQIRQQENIKTR